MKHVKRYRGHDCYIPGTYVKLKDSRRYIYGKAFAGPLKVIQNGEDYPKVVCPITGNKLYVTLDYFDLAMPDIFSDD